MRWKWQRGISYIIVKAVQLDLEYHLRRQSQTYKQGDRETERQRDRETERQRVIENK